MGLGKTAEVIALVLAHPPPPAGKDEPEEPGEGGLAPEGHVKRSPKEDGAATSPKPEPGPSGRQWGPTLVVAPANLLQQWKSEIAHFSDLRVLLYEGLDDVPLPSEDGAGPSEPGGSGGAGGAGGGGKKRSKKRGRATQDDIEHQARLLARDLGVTAPSHVQLLLRSMEELGVPMPDWDPRLREAKAAEAERQCREADVVLTSYAVLQAEARWGGWARSQDASSLHKLLLRVPRSLHCLRCRSPPHALTCPLSVHADRLQTQRAQSAAAQAVPCPDHAAAGRALVAAGAG